MDICTSLYEKAMNSMHYAVVKECPFMDLCLIPIPSQAVTADSGSENEAMEQKRALEEVCDM